MNEKKILVVISKPQDWWLVPVLEQLSQDLPIKVAGLIPPSLTAFSQFHVDFCFFHEDSRMLGYLPNLDSILDDVGLVIATDNSSIASFQACRLASKYSLPFMVFYSGVQYQYNEARINTRAIKFDINLHAKKFVTFSERSRSVLLDEGVDDSKILVSSPSVAAVKLNGNGLKFRSYFGIPAERDLVIYHDLFEVGRGNETVIDAAKLSQTVKYGDQSPIWIMAGSGSNAANLKLSASRLGLQGTTLFLEQDLRPFLKDMISAADFYIPSLVEDHEMLVPFLGYAQQAFVDGAEIILSPEGHQAEIVKDLKLRTAGTGPESLVACLNTLATLRGLDDRTHQMRHKLIVEGESSRIVLKMLLKSYIQSEVPIHNFETILTQIEELIPKGRHLDAITMLDDLLLKVNVTDRQKAQVWRLKGDLEVDMGDFDKGSSSYERALSYDRNCTDAYIGLGVISLRSKASDEALTFFSKAHAIDPTKQKVAVGMANACADGGLLSEAIWWIEKSLGMPGSDFSATAAINRISSIMPDRKQARKFLERAYETMGDHPSIMMGLGRAYLEEGKFDQGNALIRRALDKTAA
ncbi:MAG: tetratricopeptide repeat protein [Pseudomonadota bacterium]